MMKTVDAIDAIPIKNDFTGKLDFELSIESGGRVYPFRVSHDQVAELMAQLGEAYSKHPIPMPGPTPEVGIPSHPRSGDNEPRALHNRFEASCAVCDEAIPEGAAIWWYRWKPGRGGSKVWHSAHGQHPPELAKLFQ